MDFYEGYLLQRAVEACRERSLMLTIGDGVAEAYGTGYASTRGGPTLEAALRSLLDDLGVEYEERPSAERVTELGIRIEQYADQGFRGLTAIVRDEFSHHPLTVLALLAEEGGE